MKIVQGEEDRTRRGSPLEPGPEPLGQPHALVGHLGTGRRGLVEGCEQGRHRHDLPEFFGCPSGQREPHPGGRFGGGLQQGGLAHPRLALDEEDATTATGLGTS
jgi:hypothetical protein